MKQRTIVVGQFGKEITGERLCCEHLVRRLKFLGLDPLVLSKFRGWFVGAKADDRLILFLGSSLAGFLRDWITLFLNRRSERYIYIHNRSWARLLCFSGIQRMFLGPKVKIWTLTEGVRSQLKEGGWNSFVLRNTLTANELESVVSAPEKRLFWMSAITSEKGFDHAYEAFKILKRRDGAWRFDVFGRMGIEGEYSDAQFFGSVAGEEKRRAFAAGGILVLPSRYVNETQPLCLIEALSVGMPVVASAIGGIPEIVGKGNDAAGYSIEGPTADSIASAVEDVFRRYTFFGERARLRFDCLFAPDRYDRELTNLLK